MVQSVQFHTRLPPSVLDQLRTVAATKRWSAASLGALLIEEGLQRMLGGEQPEAPMPAPKAGPILVLDAADTIKRELKQKGVQLGSEEQKLRSILPDFPNVRDVETARAEGWRAWVEKRSGIALITKLFWGDDEAIRLADRAVKDRINKDRRWERFGGVGPWYAEVHLVGQAAGSAAKIPVTTLAEAQALGEEGLRRHGMAPMSIAKIMRTPLP
jgi:hypothetical protein